MTLTPRKVVSLAGAAAIGVSLLTGAATATGSTKGARQATPSFSSQATPSFSKLTPAQVKARSAGKQESMVVVFDNQLTNLPANRSHRTARAAAAKSLQAPLVSQLRQVGASKVRQLSLIDAVAAKMPAAEARALSNAPGVEKVVPDGTIVIGGGALNTPTVSGSQVEKPSIPTSASDGQQLCSASPDKPLLEPEALTSIHDASDDPSDTAEAANIATGQGVIVGNVEADDMAGNPNMIRPDGQPVIIDATNPTENIYSDEFNGDVSTIAAQGTVTYTYASQLPYSSISPNCTFRVVGDATGASLVTTGYFSDTNSLGQVVAPESQVITGLQDAVNDGANVVSESYGYGALPGANDDLLAPTNDAMAQAGVVVVESAGDSGSSGTVEAPADDPNVIDVGGTNDLRLLAQAYGYTKGWEDDNMTTLSSGGTAPNGAVVDLVAPGFAALAPVGVGQDPPLPTEAFGGTSESAPFVSGAAADVIQAYRDTHGGATPTPAMVKQILTSTATDIGAPADQQGAGLLNVYAAVEAAQQMPGSTSSAAAAQSALVDSPTQLDVQGQGGTTVHDSVKLYNASSTAERVSGTYRSLGGEFSLGRSVTERVSAPAASATIPAQGATAAAPVSFNVPSGVSVLDADMRWPDPTNSDDNILTFILTDPSGKVAQQSYDYGASNGNNASPDIQHSTVEHPMAGTWTAQIVWSNGRGHFQNPPDTPGTYTGTVTFQASGQDFTTSAASAPVTIQPHSSATVPLSIGLPRAAGDAPESVQFTSSTGVATSVPIARRTLIPSNGGSFDATLTSSVSRGPGQIKTFYVNVPSGKKDLDVSLFAPDHATDDPVYYYLFSPADLEPSVTESGNIDVTAVDATPTSGNLTGNASLITPNPQAGLWEIDVMQGATTDGTEFSQTVLGSVAYNRLAPVTARGLPKSTKTKIASGASVPITVKVKNTTNHIGFFLLGASSNDISGGNAVTPLELGPGASGRLTATLSPTAAPGTVENEVLSVIDSTDALTGFEPAVGFPDSFSDFGDLGYAYTVGGA